MCLIYSVYNRSFLRGRKCSIITLYHHSQCTNQYKSIKLPSFEVFFYLVYVESAIPGGLGVELDASISRSRAANTASSHKFHHSLPRKLTHIQLPQRVPVLSNTRSILGVVRYSIFVSVPTAIILRMLLGVFCSCYVPFVFQW